MQGADGKLYGTTYWGGTGGLATVYQLTPAGVYKSLDSFVATDGSVAKACSCHGHAVKEVIAVLNQSPRRMGSEPGSRSTQPERPIRCCTILLATRAAAARARCPCCTLMGRFTDRLESRRKKAAFTA
jgi:uncharacterized repeat protein (TIGR03803 family)